MKCHHVRLHMSAFLDSELDHGTTFQIAEHLRGCEPCRLRFDLERDVELELTQRVLSGDLPAAVWRTLEASIRKSAAPPRVAPRRTTAVHYAAWFALAASIVIGVVAWRAERDSIRTGGQIEAFLAMTDGGYRDAWLRSTTPIDADSEIAPGLAWKPRDEGAGHEFGLFAVRPLPDEGSGAFEVKLTCCGEPVLVRIARVDAVGPFADVAKQVASQETLTTSVDELRIAVRRTDKFVLVAISRHPVTQLIDAISVS